MEIIEMIKISKNFQRCDWSARNDVIIRKRNLWIEKKVFWKEVFLREFSSGRKRCELFSKIYTQPL